MNKQEQKQEHKPGKKTIYSRQIWAMQHIERLVKEITSSNCEELIKTLKENAGSKTYSETIQSFLPPEESEKMLPKTLRSITGQALKELLINNSISEKDYLFIINEGRRGGAKRGVIISQNIQGQTPMSKQEKEILNTIGTTKDPKYRKGEQRKIQEIAKYMFEKTGTKRSDHYIAKYLRLHFKQERKEIISWEEHPDEIILLKKLFEENYIEGKKLPIQEMAQTLNKEFNHERTADAVWAYIRNHWKEK